MSCNKFSL